MRIACVALLALTAIQSPAPQSQNGWEPRDAGRFRGLTKTTKARETETTVILTWMSPSAYGERISAMSVCKTSLSHRDTYSILGVEGGSLRLRHEISFQDVGEKGLRKESEQELSIPMFEGAYYLCPPDAVEGGPSFRITPNKPRVGLLEITTVW